jgi:hypothetical protein
MGAMGFAHAAEGRFSADAVAYFVAGRSSFLDSGIDLYGLDPRTGQVLCHKHPDGSSPDIPQHVGRPYVMEGAKQDILSSDRETIFMYCHVWATG